MAEACHKRLIRYLGPALALNMRKNKFGTSGFWALCRFLQLGNRTELHEDQMPNAEYSQYGLSFVAGNASG